MNQSVTFRILLHTTSKGASNPSSGMAKETPPNLTVKTEKLRLLMPFPSRFDTLPRLLTMQTLLRQLFSIPDRFKTYTYVQYNDKTFQVISNEDAWKDALEYILLISGCSVIDLLVSPKHHFRSEAFPDLHIAQLDFNDSRVEKLSLEDAPRDKKGHLKKPQDIPISSFAAEKVEQTPQVCMPSTQMQDLVNKEATHSQLIYSVNVNETVVQNAMASTFQTSIMRVHNITSLAQVEPPERMMPSQNDPSSSFNVVSSHTPSSTSHIIAPIDTPINLVTKDPNTSLLEAPKNPEDVQPELTDEIPNSDELPAPACGVGDVQQTISEPQNFVHVDSSKLAVQEPTYAKPEHVIVVSSTHSIVSSPFHDSIPIMDHTYYDAENLPSVEAVKAPELCADSEELFKNGEWGDVDEKDEVPDDLQLPKLQMQMAAISANQGSQFDLNEPKTGADESLIASLLHEVQQLSHKIGIRESLAKKKIEKTLLEMQSELREITKDVQLCKQKVEAFNARFCANIEMLCEENLLS